MEPLARLLVSLVELAEAELSTLNRSLLRLGLSLVLVIGAGVVGVTGLGLVIIAAFLLLKAAVGLIAAFALSGAICLAGAAAMGVIAFKKKSSPPVAAASVDTSEEPSDENASLRIAS